MDQLKSTILKGVLCGSTLVIKLGLKINPTAIKFAGKTDCVAQITLKDDSIGRYFIFKEVK